MKTLLIYLIALMAVTGCVVKNITYYETIREDTVCLKQPCGLSGMTLIDTMPVRDTNILDSLFRSDSTEMDSLTKKGLKLRK